MGTPIRPPANRTPARRAWVVGVFLMGMVVLGAIGWAFLRPPEKSPAKAQKLAVGLPAPEFRGMLLDGSPVTRKSLHGKPAVVNFFATWCKPCLVELPYFDRLHRTSGDRLRVLMVNVGDAPEQVRTFVEANGFRFPVVLDADGRMSKTFSVYGIPWSVVIDAQGVVRAIRPGPVRDWDDLMGLVQGVLER